MARPSSTRPYAAGLNLATSICLQEAFRDDPVFKACYTSAEWQEHGKHVFSWLLWAFGACSMTECSTADDGSSDVMAAAVWEPSSPPFGFIWRSLVVFLWYTIKLGPRKAWTLVKMFVALESKRRKHAAGAHHLQLLGTSPSCQGHGIGSQLIKTGLKRADELNLCCYLESSNPANIPFYKRHGFLIVEEYYHFGKAGPVLTLMVRKRHTDS